MSAFWHPQLLDAVCLFIGLYVSVWEKSHLPCTCLGWSFVPEHRCDVALCSSAFIWKIGQFPRGSISSLYLTHSVSLLHLAHLSICSGFHTYSICFLLLQPFIFSLSIFFSLPFVLAHTFSLSCTPAGHVCKRQALIVHWWLLTTFTCVPFNVLDWLHRKGH